MLIFQRHPRIFGFGICTTTNDLLQRRPTELRDAEAYLTLIDDVADSEVVQLVEHLNDQIFQCAALISDAPVFSSNGRHDGKASEAARTRLSQASSLGVYILASLSDVAPGKDSTLVQVALQAGMAEYARRLETLGHQRRRPSRHDWR